ncbi:EAL domain-containing protein [Halioxenophilus aromaticivorans]|uniref:cyclic-guanylate-specific phosphodiesterase n=1 Tax=Halioxenophilus aromaticivorans TaxID=1306992 RepID=A0AAV3U114_9ALTE
MKNSSTLLNVANDDGQTFEIITRSNRLLYVEDDPVQSALIVPLLESEDFFVCHVKDGREALNTLLVESFDIVLTDHYMPNMSGVELLKAIVRADFNIPVVIMTAANDLSLAFDALNNGAVDFITKDGDGNYVGYIGSVLERSLKKHELDKRTTRLENDLEREREISRLTLDAIAQGVVTLDASLRAQYCNTYFKSLCGGNALLDSIGYTTLDLAALLAEVGTVNGCKTDAEIDEKIQSLIEGQYSFLEYNAAEIIYEIRSVRLGDNGYVLSFTDVTSSKQVQYALHDVIKQAPVAITAINEDGELFLANESACQLMGAMVDELVGVNVNHFIATESLAEFKNLLHATPDANANNAKDIEITTSEGTVIPVEVSVSSIDIGSEIKKLLTLVNISQRKKAEETMRKATELQHAIIEYSPFNIVATDLEGTITAVSPALENTLGYSKEELVHKQNILSLHEREELGKHLAATHFELTESKKTTFNALTQKAMHGIIESKEWTYVQKNGQTLPVNLTTTVMRHQDGKPSGFLFVSYDITEQKKANDYIEHLAHHDSLTGLPNRALMHDRLSQSVCLAKRHSVKTGILAIDLDHFKRVNDTLGHLAGDELLKEVAKRLQKTVRDSDTVCRMGGDEFVIILDDIANHKAMEIVALKVIDALGMPIRLGATSIKVTPSIGISMAPDDGTTVEELLKHADIAMYQVKQSGRNSFAAFTQELADKKLKHIALEQDLHRAFEKEELSLYYQPQVDLLTGKVVGVEALLRWAHPEKGMIPPSQFVPIAEDTGLIVPLGEWVLNKACREIQTLRKQHKEDYTVAVNVSPRQFDDPNFIRATDLAMRRCGLPPNRLELEITEGLLVNESESVCSKLSVLNRMGVALALDDFGTGYSSLSYVAKYPVSVIKIDRAFMSLDRKENAAIVGAITAIADGLGLEVLAEGVETSEQQRFIAQRGCRLVQGFYYAKPVPFSSLPRVIEKINGSLSSAAV